MDLALLAPLVLVVAALLLVWGHSQLAEGLNARAAHGAVLVVLAGILGLVGLLMVASLDVW